MLNGAADLKEMRVAFLAPPGFRYVATQWGIWRAGGIAVPLAVMHPRPELEYVVDDSGAEILVAHPNFEARARPIAEARGVRFVRTAELLDAPEASLPKVAPQRRAMILYPPYGGRHDGQAQRGGHDSREHSGPDRVADFRLGMELQ